jgi:serine/threonine-protein kinase
VLLGDSGSEHGASPVVTGGAAARKWSPKGRGNYQMLGEIARGGMGVILKGHDTDLGRDVALKVLDGELAKNPAVVQRFIEEAQIGGQLQHPGIVPVYELGLMADESPYFTMKLVKGQTLASLLQERRTPTDDRGRLLSIFESVCQTVGYAHSKGVLHRDLKPANVMVGAFGEVQVVDWGLAKVLRRGGVADEKRAKESVHTIIATVRSGHGGSGSSGSDSMIGSVMGTPAYMGPEQAQGEVEMLDERADVFSLGAILCEILTGRPPYVRDENAAEPETIVSQAAHAKLGPARERIEASDADPALKKVCLDCLMTARAARPANAGQVAKAVHEYMVSVESRAREAQLEAEKARIKAAEERRARRLTVALAGAIAVALLLGGGGFLWVNRLRAQHLDQTRTVVEAAQSESIDLSRAGKPDEALASAKRALALAESGDADAALLARAKEFVAKAEAGVGAAEREKKLREQDATLLNRLIELRLKQLSAIDKAKREKELDAQFTKAFLEYGVDLEGADLVPALKRIRERSIAQDVALSLDDWGRLRRKVQGAKSEKAENLLLLAMDLDPDPLRMRMREAIAAHDLKAMLELTSSENLARLGPGSISVVCAAIWADFPEGRDEVRLTMERAARLFPGDYGLLSIAGYFCEVSQRHSLALYYRAAALGARPDDVTARMFVAESLFQMGRIVEAREMLRACTAADPSNAEAFDYLGITQFLLGNHAGALATLSSSPEVATSDNARSDLEVARFYNGISPREEIERRAASEFQQIDFAAYVYALLNHPDPAQRDPKFALTILEQRAAVFGAARWKPMLEMLARVRLEDWPGALALYEGPFKPPYLMLLTPACYDFIAALIYAHNGRDAAAQQAYKRAMTIWEDQTRDHPEEWVRSDAMLWRREAEAAMKK